MKLDKKILLLPFTLLAMLLSPAAVAVYPEKPVRTVISYPPGGSTDLIGRLVMSQVSKIAGQEFVIDNRGGAAGSIAAAMVARAAPDGYTVLVHSASMLSTPHLMKLPYDTFRDFIPVGTMAQQVFMLAVHPTLPVKDVRGFIALAKKRPNEIFYGTGGVGSALHVGISHFGEVAGIKLVHVPFKGGGPAYVALVSGEVQLSMPSVGSVMSYVKAGRMRVLGISSSKRSKAYPDIPAISEQLPGFEFTGWVGLFAPAGMPQAMVSTLNGYLKQVLTDPKIEAKLQSLAFPAMYTTSEQLAKRMKVDYEKNGRIIRQSGATNPGRRKK
jgi:tripartite-type tricarboxylate transporter receptor subunit TctC